MAELSDMRFAHTEGVCDLVFAPDGRVVTCGADGEVSGRIMEFCYGQSYQIAVKTKRKSLAKHACAQGLCLIIQHSIFTMLDDRNNFVY